MRETEEPYTLLHLQFHIYKSIIFSYRCLHKTGGSLQFRTEKCIKIIECCFKLHNKAISERVPLQAGNNAVPVYHNPSSEPTGFLSVTLLSTRGGMLQRRSYLKIIHEKINEIHWSR